MGEKLYVHRNGDGGWDVRVPGSHKPSSQHRTMTEAKRVAIEVVRAAGGGEVMLDLPSDYVVDHDTGPE